MPDTVEDDDEGSDGTPSDDLESAAPIESKTDTVKFGWIRGVLVSYVRSWVCFIEAGSLYITVGPGGAFKISLGVICICSRVAGIATKRSAKRLFSANYHFYTLNYRCFSFSLKSKSIFYMQILMHAPC